MRLNKKRLSKKWLAKHKVGTVHNCGELVWIVLPQGVNGIISRRGVNRNGRKYSQRLWENTFKRNKGVNLIW